MPTMPHLTTITVYLPRDAESSISSSVLTAAIRSILAHQAASSAVECTIKKCRAKTNDIEDAGDGRSCLRTTWELSSLPFSLLSLLERPDMFLGLLRSGTLIEELLSLECTIWEQLCFLSSEQ